MRVAGEVEVLGRSVLGARRGHPGRRAESPPVRPAAAELGLDVGGPVLRRRLTERPLTFERVGDLLHMRFEPRHILLDLAQHTEAAVAEQLAQQLRSLARQQPGVVAVFAWVAQQQFAGHHAGIGHRGAATVAPQPQVAESVAQPEVHPLPFFAMRAIDPGAVDRLQHDGVAAAERVPDLFGGSIERLLVVRVQRQHEAQRLGVECLVPPPRRIRTAVAESLRGARGGAFAEGRGALPEHQSHMARHRQLEQTGVGQPQRDVASVAILLAGPGHRAGVPESKQEVAQPGHRRRMAEDVAHVPAVGVLDHQRLCHRRFGCSRIHGRGSGARVIIGVVIFG